MATIYSLTWRPFGKGYVANVDITLSGSDTTVYLRGSHGRDNVEVRNVEIDARTTTSPVILTIDTVVQTIQAGGFASYNLTGISNIIIVSRGVPGEVVGLNFYDVERTEWR